jgi:dTDP-4-amino-4,6-dideoxygalactose transaminase
MKRVKPYYNTSWIKSLEEYLKHYEFWHDGIIEHLEKKILDRVGSRKYALAVNSSSNAIFMALYVWSKIHPGRNEVIIPNWGYPAAFKACLVLGLEPVPVDINPVTFGLTGNDIFNNYSERTLAVVHIENNGIMGEAQDLASTIGCIDNDILFIEDSAPSLLQMDAGCFGDVAMFSLSPTKPLMAGEGSVMLMDNDILYKELRLLRHTPNYENKEASLNFCLSPFLAAYVLPQFDHLRDVAKMRERVHNWYAKHLDIFSETTNFHGAIMYLSDKAEEISRKLIMFNIEHRYKYYPCYVDDPEKFPVSCRVRDQLIDLPMHHELTEKQVEAVCNIVKRTIL